jgi:uncharacterized protein (TIGR00255 family)
LNAIGASICGCILSLTGHVFAAFSSSARDAKSSRPATSEGTRLRSHLAQLRELVASATPEPVGRKLEFLIQELGREANTTGAKLTDAAAAQQVLEVKAELERMREQVQNVL